MHKFMQIAIEEAKKTVDDVPVGAVLVKDGEIIAKAHNNKETDKDITSHAEILVLREASKIVNNWRLEGCDLYVTLEPCPMCGWAVLQSRINNLYFGSYDSEFGAFSSKVDLRKISNSKTNIFGGIKEVECDALLKEFFNKIRS